MQRIGRTLILCALVAIASTALAADVPQALDAKDEGRVGEVHVDLKNAEYVKVELNGDSWSAHEFENGGKRLLIKGLMLDEDGPFEITLTPFDESYEPVTFTVDVGKNTFKRQYARSLKAYILVHKAKPVTFARNKDARPAPKPGEDPGEEPTRPPDKPNDDTDL